jgi:hypothetical protein
MTGGNKRQGVHRHLEVGMSSLIRRAAAVAVAALAVSPAPALESTGLVQ